MFKNVVAGVDEHQGGHDAIALASRLMQQGGNLTLVHVYPGHTHSADASETTAGGGDRERALALITRAREEAAVDAHAVAIAARSPGRGLHEQAHDVGADLLVVGSCHRGVLGRVMLGDDTLAALDNAPCAVAIAPAGYAHQPRPIRRIGVGYNESVESRHALAVARTLAGQYGAALSALQAVALPSYAFTGGWVGPLDDMFEGIVTDALERLSKLDGVEPHASYGEAGEELAVYSASVDLLVIGSRDYGPAGRLIHGSTSRRLARSARCPLLVLTRAARAADLDAPAQDAAGTAAG